MIPDPLHPAVVHFPIVLLLLGAPVAVVAVFVRGCTLSVLAVPCSQRLFWRSELPVRSWPPGPVARLQSWRENWRAAESKFWINTKNGGSAPGMPGSSRPFSRSLRRRFSASLWRRGRPVPPPRWQRSQQLSPWHKPVTMAVRSFINSAWESIPPQRAKALRKAGRKRPKKGSRRGTAKMTEAESPHGNQPVA